MLRYCEYHLIVREADRWQGFLMARSINTLDSFRSCAWVLEARFLRVLRTKTRNIGRNRVSSVSVRKPPLAFLDRRSLKPLIFWWNILCLASVACFYRIAMKPLIAVRSRGEVCPMPTEAYAHGGLCPMPDSTSCYTTFIKYCYN